MSDWVETRRRDGARIPYRVQQPEAPVEGAQRTIVLVPGLGNSSRLFGTLPQTLARLGFCAVSYDPPGLGRAGDGAPPWTFEAALDDLETLLDTLELERAEFLATSMGGKVTLGFAARAPERVERAVLYGTECLGGPRARAIYELFEVAFGLQPASEVVRVMRPLLFGRSFQKRRERVVDDILRGYAPSEADRATTQCQIAALKAIDFAAFLPAVTAEVVCHAGLEDSLVDVEDIRDTARSLPNGRFVEVPEAGHSMLLENPKVCLQALER